MSVAYLTADEYSALMGGSLPVTIDQSLVGASIMLDARLGAYTPDEATGMKLAASVTDEITTLTVAYDGDTFTTAQQDAIKRWVAMAAKYIEDNGQAMGLTGSVQLGKYSRTFDADSQLRAAMSLVDSMLVQARVIRRYPVTDRTTEDV